MAQPLTLDALASDVVHVWFRRLGDDDEVARARAILTPAELDRAARSLAPCAAARRLTARLFLREVLSHVLDRPPKGVDLAVEPGGKPYVARVPSLRISLSHSADVAAVAVAIHRDVGVDVEKLRPVKRAEGVAARLLSAQDRAALGAAGSPAERTATFLRMWVASEALAKAWGSGLSAVADASSRLAASAQESTYNVAAADGRVWAVARMPAPDGYVAAVAAEGSGWQVKTGSM